MNPMKPSILNALVTIAGLAAIFSNLGSLWAEQPSPPAIQNLIATAKSQTNSRQPYQFNASAYLESTRHLPIGVFDSGIGGLTVLEAILALDAFDNQTLSPVADGRRDFEHERFIYLGDQANMPYGNYAAVGKEIFLRELILKDTIFLLGQRYWSSYSAKQPSADKLPVKAVVIACNTATAYGLEDIRTATKAWNIPIVVVGVVEAGARGVTEELGTKDPRRGVGVLATVGTCSSMAYPKAIGTSVGISGKRLPEIVQQGSVGLAGAIEGDPAFVSNADGPDDSGRYQGPSSTNAAALLDCVHIDRYGFEPQGILKATEHPESWKLNSISNYVRYDVYNLVENYRSSGGVTPIDTVVLGCTHFPLVQTEIQAAFNHLRDYQEDGKQPYRELVAKKISLVNPAELTAKELFRSLAQARLRLDSDEKPALERDQFFISVADPNWPHVRLNNEGGLDRDYKYGREAGQRSLEDTRVVPMAIELLPDSSLHLIRNRLPFVWARLK
ncbi:MAG: aspartate/glutamate racemase family protein [Pirellulaceae bacterium]|nr:aspartate/glutamate racemase family protein [Pirellulaceae bacterium]